MNDKEILRLGAVRDVCANRIRRIDAARILSISVRQVKRLVTRFVEFHASSLISLQRGRPSNHHYYKDLKLQTLAIIYEHYIDFGPTLAHEKLAK